MRILFVSHLFPPAHTAGTETYAFNLARRLKERHGLRVFHAEKRVAEPDWALLPGEADGVRTAVLVNNLRYRSFRETFSNPKAEAAFGRVLDEFAPHVVHVHHLMHLSLRLPRIAAERGIPVVMTLHDFHLACPRGGRLMYCDEERCAGPEEERCASCLSALKYTQGAFDWRMISLVGGVKRVTGLNLTKPLYWIRDRMAAKAGPAGGARPGPAAREGIAPFPAFLEERRALVGELFDAVDVFLSPSRTVGEGLLPSGLPERKLRYWKYGIDTRPLAALRRPARRTPVFGYLGTLAPHKGVHVLVQAASSMEPGLVEVLVRGAESVNPVYAANLKKMAGPSVRFKPAFGRNGVREAFSEIDVLVLPSLWLENSPVVIQEAFAGGCPVIASDLGGMEELVRDGQDGRLFPPGDAAALRGILEEAGRRPEIIASWRAGIRPPRTIEDDADCLEALYGELCARRVSGRPDGAGEPGRENA